MSDIDSVSTGDFVTVLEDETVVVEGDVVNVSREDGSVTVEIEERDGSLVEFSKGKANGIISMGRRPNGRLANRISAIPINNDAVLEIES